MRISKRIRLIALLLALTFILGGCSTLRYLDGSTEREISAFCSEQKVNAMGETEDMERRRIEIEQQAQQQIAAALEKHRINEQENTSSASELASLRQDVGELEEQVDTLEAENRRLRAEKIQSKLESISMKIDMPKGAKTAKIKVLSGSSNLTPALNMVKRLETMGYKVDKMDLAPSTAFPNDKIFFSKGFSDEAKQLGRKIGSTTVVTPLTWKSKFDIIVVTRNKSFVQ